MKINKYFLSKIIKEEIKKILYEEDLERELISLFVKYRNYLTKNPTYNKSVLNVLNKKIKLLAPNLSFDDIYKMLNGKIDRQLMSFISNALKRDARMVGFSDKLDSYEMSISPEEQNVYQVYNKQDPDPGFMRVPKNDAAYDQEDVRKNRKTLIHEEEKPDSREAKSILYVKMSPQKFLQFATKDVIPCSERVKNFSGKKYDDTGLRGMPYLRINLDTNTIISHEGRGRMCLAIANGLSDVTVSISFVKDKPERRVAISWESFLKKVYIRNEDKNQDVDLSGITLVKEPPDWFRRLRIYAVKYIYKSRNREPEEMLDFNINLLTIGGYIEYPEVKEPLEIYKLLPNKTVSVGEPPYDLNSEGLVIIKDKNVDNTSIWEKIPETEWNNLLIRRK